MQARIVSLQKQLESYIDSSPQIYLNEIRRLKAELDHSNELDVNKLIIGGSDSKSIVYNSQQIDKAMMKIPSKRKESEKIIKPTDTGATNRS